jgi:hypothetical protein
MLTELKLVDKKNHLVENEKLFISLRCLNSIILDTHATLRKRSDH